MCTYMYLCFGKCVNVCDSVYICEVPRQSPTRSFAHVLNKREKKISVLFQMNRCKWKF